MTSARERFLERARDVGVEPDIVVFGEETRTAVQAAAAVPCELGQIVKSLIFRSGSDYVLVLTAGTNRVDESRAAELLGVSELGRADADGAREATGFAIGGIPPFGHRQPLATAFDEDLLKWSEVWGAAGTPDSVFNIDPRRLADITKAAVGTVAVR